eukprot:2899401-Rhodomonas_salina.1
MARRVCLSHGGSCTALLVVFSGHLFLANARSQLQGNKHGRNNPVQAAASSQTKTRSSASS